MTHRITDEELIDYAAGDVTGEEADRVRAAIAEDPDAARTVGLYRLAARRTAEDDTLAPPVDAVSRAKAIFRPNAHAPALSWPERLEIAIARLIYDSRLQPAAVRHAGVEERVQLAFETDGAEIDLRITPASPARGTARASGRLDVMGQVTAASAAVEIEVAALRAGTTTPVASACADAHGVFHLELSRGVYDLRLLVGERVVLLPAIEIG